MSYSPTATRRRSESPEHVRCYDCSRIHDVDPVFETPVDPDTGDTVHRMEVPAV